KASGAHSQEASMAVKVLELHHHGIRVGATEADADRALAFYGRVLGLAPDQGRPYIADIPGYWLDGGPNAQIHLIRTGGRYGPASAEEIAPLAARYDSAGTNPVESWRALEREGFLGAAIPKAYGGLGLDMPTYIAVVRTLAGGCANTAMTVHMHSTVMRFIAAPGTEAQ